MLSTDDGNDSNTANCRDGGRLCAAFVVPSDSEQSQHERKLSGLGLPGLDVYNLASDCLTERGARPSRMRNLLQIVRFKSGFEGVP
jgi:hypothetical protein